MRKAHFVFIMLAIILFGDSAASALESRVSPHFASTQDFKHKSQRSNFFIAGNTGYVYADGGHWGAGVSVGVNVRLLALEVSVHKWRGLPKISSLTAFLNIPIRRLGAEPFILAEIGGTASAGKLSDEDIPDDYAGEAFLAIGMGAEIGLTSSIALQPEFRIAVLGLGLLDFENNSEKNYDSANLSDFRLKVVWILPSLW